MKRTYILWITVLVLGWLFDFLFWGHAPGINFAIYVVLCLVGGFLVLSLNGFKPSWKALILLAPVLFFAVITLIRQEPMILFLSFGFTLGSMGLLAVSYLGGRWIWYSLPDYIINGLRLIASMITRPLIYLVETRNTAPAQDATRSRFDAKRLWAVLRGVLIAIPIVAIFTALLSSADLVFARQVQDFVRLFRLENLLQYIFRCVYILIGAYALAGVFLHAAKKSQDEKLVGIDKPLVAPFLGFTEAAVVLGAVVLLFLLFAIVQFRYFFGGQTNIGIQGYTYAEYARRGFTELVAVAFFSLLLFLGLSGIVKRQNATQRWVFTSLGLGMVALVGVMLFSAFQRLALYEAAYGFSRIRIYTHTFMIWLGLLLAVVVVLEVLHRERAFALAILVASFGFAATLAVINVDGFIVRQNVARATDGKSLDVAYLSSLTPDSVPDLVAEFRNNSIPASTRDAVGVALVCRCLESNGRGNDNWLSFTLSNWWASRALERVQSQLDQFKAVYKDGSSSILTPAGVQYDCYQTGGM
jgi:hypothetical protein